MPKQSNIEPQSLSNQILDCIAKVDRPAEYCTSGQGITVLPGLQVAGIGDIGMPLSPTQAKQLIKVCRQAPYGKGTETVVDTKVRKVWELDPTQFSLTNPKWSTMIELLMLDIETKLGLPLQKLTPHLYKLLVYEKGGFFLPHRDGEKLDRMVATLVINLPSKHSGGELVVYHEGRETVIAMPRAATGVEIDYAAFYADCQHEVKPLLSGYRLCLTYNLVLDKSRSKVGVSAPNFSKVVDNLADTFTEWGNSSADSANKLAVLLEHRYTQGGLRIDNLKGVDRAKAEVLFDAAEKSDCEANLALVTLWQAGSAEGGYDDYGYGRRRRGYSRWEDDDDEEDEDDEDESPSQYTMGEVHDSSLSVDNWSNRHGKKVPLSGMPLDESEIVSAKDLTQHDPSKEEFEGYTGNAGMTLERWYHQAAIVIWPRSNQFKVFCQAGTDAAIGGLAQMIAKTKKAKKADRTEQFKLCRQFASQIIESWDPIRYVDYSDLESPIPTSRRETIFNSLAELNDLSLVRQVISRLMPQDWRLSFPKQFANYLAKQGWSEFEDALKTCVSIANAQTVMRDIKLLEQIASCGEASAVHTALCLELSSSIVQAIEQLDNPNVTLWNSPRWERKELVVNLVRVLVTLNEEVMLDRFVTWLADHPRYELIELQIPAIEKLASVFTAKPRIKPLQKWLKKVKKELDSRTKSKPKEPVNWKRDSTLNCSCADCTKLSQFLADPDQPEARFPLAKARRQHLHGIIDRNKIDCTHTTLRVGSPQVLVCKKTNNSFKESLKVYEQDLKHLAFIKALQSP